MKLGTMIAFGVGYVLGSKAGRERYEEIRVAARKAGEKASGKLDTYAEGGTTR